jgi:hypothetical protein
VSITRLPEAKGEKNALADVLYMAIHKVDYEYSLLTNLTNAIDGECSKSSLYIAVNNADIVVAREARCVDYHSTGRVKI